MDCYKASSFYKKKTPSYILGSLFLFSRFSLCSKMFIVLSVKTNSAVSKLTDSFQLHSQQGFSL